ncbi:MAG: sel1 repeat family protein [Pseudomonadota bacterium]
MRFIAVLAVFWVGAAGAEDLSAYGTTNPEELTMGRVLSDVREGKTGMTHCASGYFLTKKGDHGQAREVFQACAEAGYTAAMNWMAQLDNNGLGADYNPDASAEWSRRSAALGDRVGKFNYGIDLMRGHGVAQDEATGRRLVDEAAREGLTAAKRLKAANYDLDEVTPDADNWRYAPIY